MIVKINGEYEVRIKEEDIVVKDKRLYNTTTKKYEGADGDIVEFITEENGIRRWHSGYVDGYTYGNRIPFRCVDKSEYHNIIFEKIEHVSTVLDVDGISFEDKELLAATEAL